MESTFMVWDDSYLTGIDVIDRQHKEIWRILNLAYDAKELDYSPKGIKLIIELLIEYALTHFDTEEKYMLSKHYAAIDEHVREHQDFWAKLKPLTAKALDNKDLSGEEVVSFIKYWITDHVLITDMKLKGAGNE